MHIYRHWVSGTKEEGKKFREVCRSIEEEKREEGRNQRDLETLNQWVPTFHILGLGGSGNWANQHVWANYLIVHHLFFYIIILHM